MDRPRVWEYRPELDKLLEHFTTDDNLGYTACGEPAWSPATDPAVDPAGVVSEDIWFADHERSEDIVLCAACGVTTPHH